jgi:hypothetical protein
LENSLSPPFTPNGFAITPHGEITILVLCRDFYPPNSWAGGVWPDPNELPLGILIILATGPQWMVLHFQFQIFSIPCLLTHHFPHLK